MPLGSIDRLELALGGEVLSLDHASERSHVAFVSHAHMDHVPRRSSAPILSTALTLALLRERTGRALAGTGRTSFGPFRCRLLGSSHAPGAAMLHVGGDGQDIVYTGDYCHQENAFGVAPEHVPCDVLVVDATYGDPRYSFPPREEVRSDIARWVRRVAAAGEGAVFGAYAFGKAQELVRMLTEDAGVPVLVHDDIARLNAVCESHGLRVGGALPAGSHAGREAARGGFVLVTTPATMEAARDAWARLTGRRVHTALVTGWGSTTHRCFPLSNHADFEGIMSLVAATSPKVLYTVNGSSARLARAVRERFGVEAVPLAR